MSLLMSFYHIRVHYRSIKGSGASLIRKWILVCYLLVYKHQILFDKSFFKPVVGLVSWFCLSCKTLLTDGIFAPGGRNSV